MTAVVGGLGAAFLEREELVAQSSVRFKEVSGEPRRYEVAGELCMSERTLTPSPLYMSDL
jgi:hypothetical protein